MDLGLKGKTVLITGGSKGIGFACAMSFAAEGCVLHLAARNRELLETVRRTIRAAHSGVDVSLHAVDLRDRTALHDLATACGDSDILVNNAGDIPGGTIESLDESKWRHAWELKLFGYINLTRELFRRMKARKRGVIVSILGKAEFLNPGGSVKDRAALYIILDAEKRGALKPGGVIVEGTAGNTGIGLALVGNARGYRTVIVIPDTQSQEKKDLLRLCGAELREVPAVPYKDPNNYVHVSERLAKELGAFWANQWDNTANRDGHYRSTGPEIWQQTDGKLDGFTCAIGTGGTLSGVSRFLKEKRKNVRIAAADPVGAAMYSWFKRGELKSEGSSITEGIGQGRVTKNVAMAMVDDAYQIPDAEALPLIFEMAKREGLILGGSSGINIAGAIRLARDLGPGHTVVTILADSGTRYQSKLFTPAFLRQQGLPVPDWL